jgi:hypothetical protein
MSARKNHPRTKSARRRKTRNRRCRRVPLREISSSSGLHQSLRTPTPHFLGRGNNRTAAVALYCRELLLHAMVTCNRRRLLCCRIRGRRATRSGCIASGCAPRGCGRYRSGYLTCELAPSSPLLASNPRQSPRANKQPRISNLLTLFRRTLPSEAWRDLDGVRWCELHGEAATGGHRAGGPVQSNGLNHSLRVHDRSDGSTVTAHGHRTN